MENSKNKQFILHPNWQVNCSIVLCIPLLSHLVAASVIRWTVKESQGLDSSDPYFT